MNKMDRKSEICFFGVAGAISKVCEDKMGVIGPGKWLDRRKAGIQYTAGMYLQPYKFMELFGEDTEYQYFRDKHGDLQVFTQVNGVTFYAYIRDDDIIIDGRLV